MADSCSTKPRYHNFHLRGYGYLNRIREVPVPKGKPYLACDLNVLNGPFEQPEYKRLDVLVKGKDAQVLVRRYQQAVEQNRKVLIGFNAGDLSATPFTYTTGKKAGQVGISLQVNLLLVRWIKVDGELVYKSELTAPTTQTSHADDAVESAVLSAASPKVARVMAATH